MGAIVGIHTGTIVQGWGLASKNYRVMIPEIAKCFPPVANCGLFGTINIDLDQPAIHHYADYWTPRIIWHPVKGLQQTRVESFGFIRVKFEYRRQKYDAWIILVEWHDWTNNGKGVEIIADRRIPDISYQERCSIHIDHRPLVPRPAWLRKSWDRCGGFWIYPLEI